MKRSMQYISFYRAERNCPEKDAELCHTDSAYSCKPAATVSPEQLSNT